MEDVLINGRKKFFFSNPSWKSSQVDIEDVEGEKLLFANRQMHTGRNMKTACVGLLGGSALTILCFGLSALIINNAAASLFLAILFGSAFYLWIAASRYQPRHFSIVDYETKSNQLLEIFEEGKAGFPSTHFRICRKGRTIGFGELSHFSNGWIFKKPDGALLCKTERIPEIETSGFWGAVTKTGRPQLAIYNGDSYKIQLGTFVIKRNWADRTVLDLSKDVNDTIDPWIGLGIGVLVDHFGGYDRPNTESSGGGE